MWELDYKESWAPKSWCFRTVVLERLLRAPYTSMRSNQGTTENEMVGWCHRLNAHEFKRALGVGDGQGSLACCSPWGRKASDKTEWLNWTDYSQLQLQDPLRTVEREFVSSCSYAHVSFLVSPGPRLYFCFFPDFIPIPKPLNWNFPPKI